MMIFDRLGIGGSFAEFHPVDFDEGFILVGHDGPHHINIARGRPVLRSLVKYHGKPGAGASVEFALREGPITMMSIGQKGDGAFKFVIAEGPTHHFALGIGHYAEDLLLLGGVLGIETVDVTSR